MALADNNKHHSKTQKYSSGIRQPFRRQLGPPRPPSVTNVVAKNTTNRHPYSITPQKCLEQPPAFCGGKQTHLNISRASHLSLPTSNGAVPVVSEACSGCHDNMVVNVAPRDAWACRFRAQNVVPLTPRHPEPAVPAPLETKVSPPINSTLPVAPTNSASRVLLRTDSPYSHRPPVLKGQLRRCPGG